MKKIVYIIASSFSLLRGMQEHNIPLQSFVNVSSTDKSAAAMAILFPDIEIIEPDPMPATKHRRKAVHPLHYKCCACLCLLPALTIDAVCCPCTFTHMACTTFTHSNTAQQPSFMFYLTEKLKNYIDN